MKSPILISLSTILLLCLSGYGQVGGDIRTEKSNPRTSAPPINDSYGDYVCNFNKVVDGDTLKCEQIVGLPALIGEDINIRLRGVDAPELRAKNLKEKKMAKYVKARLKKFVEARLPATGQIELRNIERGKYFRLIADVYVGGESLKEFLLQEKLTCAYNGGKRKPLAPYITRHEPQPELQSQLQFQLDCPI